MSLDEIYPEEYFLYRKKILNKFKFTCCICKTKYNDNTSYLEMHRIVLGRKGGKYIDDNILLVCRKCHHAIEGLNIDDLIFIGRNIKLKKWEDKEQIIEYITNFKKSCYKRIEFFNGEKTIKIWKKIDA